MRFEQNNEILWSDEARQLIEQANKLVQDVVDARGVKEIENTAQIAAFLQEVLEKLKEEREDQVGPHRQITKEEAKFEGFLLGLKPAVQKEAGEENQA